MRIYGTTLASKLSSLLSTMGAILNSISRHQPDGMRTVSDDTAIVTYICLFLRLILMSNGVTAVSK